MKTASVVNGNKNGASVAADKSVFSSVSSANRTNVKNLVTFPKIAQKGKVLGDVEISEEELNHLAEVCRRCELLHQQEDERIRIMRTAALKTEKSRVGVGVIDDEHCNLCGSAFYMYINPQNQCFQCERYICRKCTKKTIDDGFPICKTCFVECRNKAKTGLWFTEKLRQAKIEGRVQEVAPTYALRLSLRRKKLEASAASSTIGIALQKKIEIQKRLNERKMWEQKADLYTASSNKQRNSSDGNGVEETLHGVSQRLNTDNDSSLSNPLPLLGHRNSSWNSRDAMMKTANFNTIFADLDNLPSTLPRPNGRQDDRQKEPENDASNWDNKSMISGVSMNSMTSIYSEREDSFTHGIQITGDLNFSVDYDLAISSLIIFIKQGREIAVADKKSKTSDTYVKTYLLPDKTKLSKRKTRVKKRTLNPVFNQQLIYDIGKGDLAYRTLQISLWHHRRMTSNLFLGEIIIPMADYRFTSTPGWRALQPKVSMQSAYQLHLTEGTITLGLKYIPGLSNNANGTLQVFIKSAQNLKVQAGVKTDNIDLNAMNPFVKMALLPDRAKESKRKTKIVKKDNNPTWEEMFNYEHIAKTDLPSLGLEVFVMNKNRAGSDDFLGGCILNAGPRCGMDVEAVGEENRLWMEMISKPKVVVETTIDLRTSMD